jgi:hypothetical protein
MVAAVIATPSFANKTEVPNGWPAMVGQVSLVLRVQRLQDFRCFSTRHVVVGRQISQAPFGQLISIVNLFTHKLINKTPLKFSSTKSNYNT